MRTRDCAPGVREGRRRKALQFFDAATVISEYADEQDDVADAYVTLCVNAGIAASDAMCCAKLGYHSVGEDHRQAVALLDSVDPEAARHLSRLLSMKAKAEYLHTSVSAADRKSAERSASFLVERVRGS